jgi:DNA-binding MarR family transcriptional regulator
MATPLIEKQHMASTVREKHEGALGDHLEVRVWLRLLSCSTIVEKQLRRRFEDEFGMTLPRFDVLAALERSRDGLPMGELSRRLLVSNGNVTTVVRQLEGAGLVASRPAPGDRRSSIVALTPTGRARFKQLAGAHHQWIAEAFADMDQDSLGALYGLLAQLKLSIGKAGQEE